MFEITDPELFGKIIAEEVTAINGNRSLTTGEAVRFVNALAKAAARIEEQGCFMDYDRAADKLLIWSTGSNEIYEIEGVGICQCLAFQNGSVCWHRAAKRLISRYLVAESVETELEFMASRGWKVAGSLEPFTREGLR